MLWKDWALICRAAEWTSDLWLHLNQPVLTQVNRRKSQKKRGEMERRGRKRKGVGNWQMPGSMSMFLNHFISEFKRDALLGWTCQILYFFSVVSKHLVVVTHYQAPIETRENYVFEDRKCLKLILILILILIFFSLICSSLSSWVSPPAMVHDGGAGVH